VPFLLKPACCKKSKPFLESCYTIALARQKASGQPGQGKPKKPRRVHKPRQCKSQAEIVLEQKKFFEITGGTREYAASLRYNKKIYCQKNFCTVYKHYKQVCYRVEAITESIKSLGQKKVD